MTNVSGYERALLDRFVASFERLDKMTAVEHGDSIAWQLAFGEPDQYGTKKWRAAQTTTSETCLEPVYSLLPARFPRLFESLILNYRWAEVDLKTFTLLANPPGADLGGLLQQMSKDAALWNNLRTGGYSQFGKGADLDYDPVCFDPSSRRKSGRDYRIVKVDHEQILCNDRIKIVPELALSFEALLRETIERAGLAPPNA